MTNKLSSESQKACSKRLESIEASPALIKNFLRLHALVESGTTGVIPDQSIDSLTQIPKLEEIESRADLPDIGKRLISKLVVCKLNGGLGTSMGLKSAKSLLHVRFDKVLNRRLSFNELNARQIELLSEEPVPFMNMVSFSTAKDVAADLEKCNLSASQKVFLNQNIHPKVLVDTLMPAVHEDDSMCWNPPGHGDFFEVFYSSGLLDSFISEGKRYLFVSNADNLSASPSATILNYIAAKKVPFLCEVTRRTLADRKGGHLARRKSDGRVVLREAAQAPVDEHGVIVGDFQDIERHSCFNINSIWIDLLELKRVLTENDGILPLALIRNQKTLDPRESKSAQVFQIETALGAAIEFFEGAELIEVGRDRFAPVKTSSDLLLVLSDCFELNEKGTLYPKVTPLPHITLSSEYRLIDDFEALISAVPSLISAKSFSVSGNIKISHPLSIIGSVALVDVRKDRSTPLVLGAEHRRLANVRVELSEEGESIEAVR